MADLITSANVDTLMQAADFATFRTSLGLTALATTTPGTGVATALTQNIGSVGAPILFNGAAGTPSSMVGTNITGTAAGLTAGTASAVAVGGITGLGAGVGAALAIAVGSAGGPVVNGGALGTSPSVTTSITTGSTTFALFNATATTVNAFGAATTLNIGASAATVLNFGGFTSAAELRFLEPSGSGTNYSGLKQPALAASITYLLPADAPANGDVLTSQTDGTLSWEPQSGAANAVTAASAAAGAGLFWTSGGADRTAVATDTITTVNATNANVTNFLPVSNDGAAIGASGTAFSDLFLASGAVINFNAGNYTLTHSAGVLTANLDFRVTTAGTNSASVVTVDGTQTLANKTLTSPTINAPTITYTVEPGADDTPYGERLAGILAGDTIAQWDLVYLDSTSGRWELADSDAVATGGGVLLGLAVASSTDGNALTVLLRGIVRNDGWTWASAGLKLYSSGTPGALTATQPSGTDDVIRPIADTLSDDCIFFAPGQTWATHT